MMKITVDLHTGELVSEIVEGCTISDLELYLMRDACLVLYGDPGRRIRIEALAADGSELN